MKPFAIDGMVTFLVILNSDGKVFPQHGLKFHTICKCKQLAAVIYTISSPSLVVRDHRKNVWQIVTVCDAVAGPLRYKVSSWLKKLMSFCSLDIACFSVNYKGSHFRLDVLCFQILP